MSDQNLQNLDTGLPRKPLSASPEGTDLATSVPSAGNIHNHSATSDRDRDLSASAKQIQSSGESESSIENVTTCQSSMRRMAISNILNLAEPPETNTPPQQPIQYSSFPNLKVPGRFIFVVVGPGGSVYDLESNGGRMLPAFIVGQDRHSRSLPGTLGLGKEEY